MDRRATFRIWRLLPPFTRTVAVRRITVGGFLELLRIVAPKVAGAMGAEARGLSEREFIASWCSADVLAAGADLVCSGQPVGFLRGWVHGRLGGVFAETNTARLLAACRAVEGDGQWTRFLGLINRQPSKPDAKGGKRKRGGGLHADAIEVARAFGQPPAAILAMDLQDFLNLIDSMNAISEASQPYDPTLDPEAEPTPLGRVH